MLLTVPRAVMAGHKQTNALLFFQVVEKILDKPRCCKSKHFSWLRNLRKPRALLPVLQATFSNTKSCTYGF